MAVYTEVLCIVERDFLTLILALKCLFAYLSGWTTEASPANHRQPISYIHFTGHRLWWWKTNVLLQQHLFSLDIKNQVIVFCDHSAPNTVHQN